MVADERMGMNLTLGRELVDGEVATQRLERAGVCLHLQGDDVDAAQGACDLPFDRDRVRKDQRDVRVTLLTFNDESFDGVPDAEDRSRGSVKAKLNVRDVSKLGPWSDGNRRRKNDDWRVRRQSDDRVVGGDEYVLLKG